MIASIDLRATPKQQTNDSCDICIVGAGAAGLYLARRLIDQKKVIVLEAGGSVCLKGEEIGVNPTFLADRYDGAITGRAFGVGGTTSLWGGQLLPYSDHDIRRESPYAHVWTHLVGRIRLAAQDVCRTLGLGENADYFTLAEKYLSGYLPSLVDSGFSVLASDWLPFGQRNFDYLLANAKNSGCNLRLYTNAVASRWTISEAPTPQLHSVTARSINGNEVTIAAKKFVIAAGAIESARILLEIFRESLPLATNSKRSVGHYLSDHLSVPIATVCREDNKTIRSLFGPRFKNGRLRTLRFVNAKPAASYANGFFHFIFLQENDGFHLARKIFAGLQARKFPRITPVELMKGINGIVCLGYERYARNRLFVPADTPIQLQFDMEQTPSFENYVTLSSDRDEYGRLKSAIRWRVLPEDYENLENASRDFLTRWPAKSLQMSALRRTNCGVSGTKLYETYHPVGTCRMGADHEAVVDHDLKVYGLSNAYTANTGVFPSAGTANPTFSLLCLTEILARQLSEA